MKNLNELLQELGISKVKLAKYLGVSRQMIYNYLELESLNKWPKEKKLLLFKLLDLQDGSDESIAKIKVTAEYLENVEARLNQSAKLDTDQSYFNLKDLNKEEQALVNDLINLIKEKFTEEKNKNTYYEFLYLYHVLQSIDSIPEIKYILAYLSKTTGFSDPMEFKFDETAQFILESIGHQRVGTPLGVEIQVPVDRHGEVEGFFLAGIADIEPADKGVLTIHGLCRRICHRRAVGNRHPCLHRCLAVIQHILGQIGLDRVGLGRPLGVENHIGGGHGHGVQVGL